MALNIQNNNQTRFANKKSNNNTAFGGPLDGAITRSLMTIDTNQMVNAGLLDVGAMVIPRTYIDTKKRNEFAGFETFFREISGTITQCFSAGVVALGVAAVHNKLDNKDGINISPHIWATNSTFDTMKQSWEKSEKNVDKYVEHIFSGMSGLNGNQTSKWGDINWGKVEWFDDSNWRNIKWKDPKWAKVPEKTKNGEQIVNVLSDLIKDKNADKNDANKVISILEHRIANALQVSKSVDVSVEKQKMNATLKNVIRDTYDLGKHVFNNNVDLAKAERKLKAMNKTKSLVGIGIVASVGLTVQYVNRMITKKRTGSDNFVGDTDFGMKPVENKNNENKNHNNSRLIALKTLASAGIFALSMATMNVKKPSDFLKRLEFNEIVTNGNAIKTIYMATLIGRFVAARSETELRESGTRDYLGFVNWLVFGGFVSKGAAQVLFDKKQKNLFNVKEDGSKGVKKWLNNVSLKSHAEIAAKGSKFAKENMWKLNIAHAAGFLYSGLALGCALPLLNILITKKSNKNNPVKVENNVVNGTFTGFKKSNSDVFQDFYKLTHR